MAQRSDRRKRDTEMTEQRHDRACAGEGPCVWMDAGVIDFWLCDRSFQCDSCPLDMALRGRFPDPLAAMTPTPWIPPTMLFHRSHLWINPTSNNEWAIGLDHHAWQAFMEPPTLSLPRPGRRIKQHDTLVSMLVGDEVLRWPAPMDTIVLECNDRWRTDAQALRECPYREGWLLLVKLPRRFERSAWCDADAIQASYRAEHAALKDACHSAAQSNATIGRTAADGGVLLTSPDRILPRAEYLARLRDLWGLLSTESGF